MRILHIISGLTTGGAEAVLFRLATNSSAAEHEVICLECRARYSSELEAHGIKVHHLNWRRAGSLVALFRLHRLIRSIDADLIQTWMYRANLFAGISGKIVGKPVVWNIRCSRYDILQLSTRALAYAGGIVAGPIPDRIINCSEASRQLHSRTGYPREKTIVIPNGYDPAVYGPDESRRIDARTLLRISASDFLIGAIGRWDVHKGWPVLIRALKLLSDRGISTRLLLVGHDMNLMNPKLAKLINESGCRDLIQAIGHQLDIANIARALDLHVLPSLSEGFPNVVAESMLAGTPNVATDAGDSRFIVGDTGWIVPTGDPEQLATAIAAAHREWSRSPERWAVRRKAARRRIVEKFSLEQMVSAYEKIWTEVFLQRGTNRQIGAASLGPDEAVRPPDSAHPRCHSAPAQLRILHVINSLTLGGAEALLYRLVTGDSRDEHVIVSLGPPAWYSSRIQEKGIEVHHLSLTSVRSFLRGLRRLNKIVRQSDADVVQCWMYRSNLLGGTVAKLARKPIVWGIHCSSINSLSWNSRVVAYLGGCLAGWMPDFIINCSTRSAQVHEEFGYSALKSVVVHNGYDSSFFFPDQRSGLAARDNLGIGPDEFAVGCIARWDPLKDVPNLVAAVRSVNERGIPLRCFLIGAGLERENAELMEHLRAGGCTEWIVPLGSRSDIAELARALDLHILSSRTEAFPNVVAETMLSGTPNIVTDAGDSAYMVSDTGWVVPPCDSARLADAIVQAHREWNEDPIKWIERCDAARERIVENFSFDRMAQAYRKVWRDAAILRRVRPLLKPTAVQ